MIDREFEGEFYRYVRAAGYADREWNRQVLEFYLPYFARCERVLDVGCGEGQMLELLAATGIAAAGIDSDAAMIQICRERGLEVVEADLFDYLPVVGNQFDGIFSSNLIEHLSAEQAARFVQLSFTALRPGGILVIATPNPESLIVHMHEFWRDATHVRLYNRQLLEFLLYRVGLRNIASHDNPHTTWTPPTILQAEIDHHSDGLVERASRGDLTGLAASDSVSLPAWLPPSTTLNLLPSSGTVWDPPVPEKSFSWGRRPAIWLRRCLARFLVRSVMYEEFMVVERQSADLRGAIKDLSNQIGAFAAYLPVYMEKSLEATIQALGTSIDAMETRMLGLASARETSSVDKRFEVLSRNLVNLAAAQTEPLCRPREIFAVGIKPLADGQVPSLPARPAQLPFERGDAEAAAAPAPAVIPGADAAEPVVPKPDAVAREEGLPAGAGRRGGRQGATLPGSGEQETGEVGTLQESADKPSAQAGAPKALADRIAPLVRQRTGALKVAVFTPYLPHPPDTGGKIRSFHMLRALTNRFDVDLYSVHYGAEPTEAIAALREQCCQVVSFGLAKSSRTRDRWRRLFARLPRSVDHFCTPDSLLRAQGYLRDGQYDVVVADEISMTPYAELAFPLPRIVARQKVDHIHYKEMAKARRWGRERALDSLEAEKLQRYERAKMPIYQAYVACSAHDAAIIGRDAPDAQSVVIPNGADLEFFVPSGGSKTGRPILLYVGSMNYHPNVDAVRFFFDGMYERIAQELPGVRVQIVGHAPPAEIQKLAWCAGIEVLGGVPDVRPYYDAATVFMVPLRLGGGTRLKIVEAMAMGLPVVSTSVGAEGLDIHPGQDILIADDASLFAEEVLRLFAHADLRTRLGEGGRRLAARYDWKELMRPLADLVDATARQRRGADR